MNKTITMFSIIIAIVVIFISSFSTGEIISQENLLKGTIITQDEYQLDHSQMIKNKANNLSNASILFGIMLFVVNIRIFIHISNRDINHLKENIYIRSIGRFAFLSLFIGLVLKIVAL